MITMIACVDKNMGIGKGDGLLVHLPKDLEHFKKTTLGQLCVFGKTTYETLPKKPLPDRHSIVLTRERDAFYEGCSVASNIEVILRVAKASNIFICGGGHVYKQFMPYADELIISHMKESFDADTFFPEIDKSIWEDYDSENVLDKVDFKIVKYRRKSNNPERGKSMTITTADIKEKELKELVMEFGEKAVLEAMPQKIRGFELVAFNHRKNHKSLPDKHYKNPIAIVVDGKRELRYAPSIQKPRRAEDGACASDVFSPVNTVIMPNEQLLIWTDVKAYMQRGEVLLANVRSSQGKIRIQLANTQGWIDQTYYENEGNDGNIGLFLRNEGTEPYEINAGDRIGQLMFTPFLIPDDDNPLQGKRTGGFGSTGK
ncbi:dihydrofolate reductase [Bacillus cereus]|uniref:dihydrofolate reductase n=1 Tax=Bacillus cereus TaxID=1396 RepID=UPI0039814183